MTMCAPLQQTDFCEILESFRPSLSEVPLARTSVAPTRKGKASKASGRASTSKPSVSSENAVLVGSLLKTALISELGALTPCSLHWRQSATPAGRSWFVLATSEPITNAPDHGSSDATSNRLPTPTKRDKRMDAWSPAYDKRKSPTMDAVMDGALTDRASDKWIYARQIAAILTEHGLSGASMTLPLVYGWMMGFPPAWLERALLSAVHEGQLPLASSSKRMATP